MMKFLDNFNFRRKIILLITIASSCVVIFASILWGFNDIRHLRAEIIDDLATTAKELSKGVRQDVKLDNRTKMIRNLSSLRDNPGIISAWIITPTGKIISGYLNVTDYAKKNPEILEHDYVKEHIRQLNQGKKNAVYFEKSLLLKTPVIYENQVVGYLYIFSSGEKLQTRINDHIKIVLLISLLSIGLSILLAYGMHRSISKPIVDLAKIMDGVSRTKDYSVRINVASGRDEVHDLMNIFNEMIGEIETHADIQRENEEAIKKLAYFDVLTKMPNRQLFQDYLNLVIKHANETNTSCALFFIDLNKFKQINDTMGHEYGDILLKNIAERIRTTIAEFTDVQVNDHDQVDAIKQSQRILASRIGGDEFTITAPNATKTRMTEIAERLLKNCQETLVLPDKIINPSISIGIAFYPENASSQSELVKVADLSMYKSKQIGEGSYTFYDKSVGKEFYQTFELEDKLTAALKAKEYEPRFEPIVDINTQKIIGAEAFVHFKNIDKLAHFDELITLVKDINLKHSLSETIFKDICQISKSISEMEIDPFIFSLKVSLDQMLNTSLSKILLRNIDSAGVNPSNIMLELAQDIFISKHENERRELAKLEKAGLLLSMHVLGSNDSTLASIPELPLDFLKIGKSFFDKTIQEKSYIHIIELILELAEKLKIQIIVEGVQYEEQLDYIAKYQCGYCQGYHTEEPINASALIQLLQAQQKD